MKKASKCYPLNQCALYKLRSKRLLEKRLCMKPGEVASVGKCSKYRVFPVPKNSGGVRSIEAPNEKLKGWQRRIWDLLARVEKPEWVISACRGKCHLDNAKRHQQNSFVLTIDISGFYSACEREYVYQFFYSKLCCSPDVAAILTDICTFEGGIPTGSPASQIVAYYAYEEMFQSIEALAESFGCTFSLYVDDMTFSSPADFSWRKLCNEVRLVLRRYGHRIKESKTHYYPGRKNKVITGVNLTPDGRLTAPNRLRRHVLDDTHAFKNSSDTALALKIKGRIQAASYIEGRPLFRQIYAEITEGE